MHRPGPSPTGCSRTDHAPATKSNRADRKSTRLNSSHSQISYAVFCLKKKKKKNNSETLKKKVNQNTYVKIKNKRGTDETRTTRYKDKMIIVLSEIERLYYDDQERGEA